MQLPPNLPLEEEEETETVGEEAEEVLGEEEEVHPKAKASSSQANNNLSHPQTYYRQVVQNIGPHQQLRKPNVSIPTMADHVVTTAGSAGILFRDAGTVGRTLKMAKHGPSIQEEVNCCLRQLILIGTRPIRKHRRPPRSLWQTFLTSSSLSQTTPTTNNNNNNNNKAFNSQTSNNNSHKTLLPKTLH